MRSSVSIRIRLIVWAIPILTRVLLELRCALLGTVRQMAWETIRRDILATADETHPMETVRTHDCWTKMGYLILSIRFGFEDDNDNDNDNECRDV